MSDDKVPITDVNNFESLCDFYYYDYDFSAAALKTKIVYLSDKTAPIQTVQAAFAVRKQSREEKVTVFRCYYFKHE